MVQAKHTSRLIAVCTGVADLDGFKAGFPGGETFLDTGCGLKTLLGGGKIRKAGLFGDLLVSSTFWSGYKRAKANHPELGAGSSNADGFDLGGVFVVSPSSELLFVHLEKLGEVASAESLEAALVIVDARNGSTVVVGEAAAEPDPPAP
jgi:hypothetical protein